jgi:hypothetical protein
MSGIERLAFSIFLLGMVGFYIWVGILSFRKK